MNPVHPNSQRPRGGIAGAAGRIAIVCVAALVAAGCATHAELRQVRDDQKGARGTLADLQVSVDQLRRRVDTMKSELEEAKRSARGRGGAQASPQLDERLTGIDARLAALEAGAPPQPAAPPAPPAEGGGLPESRPPVAPAPAAPGPSAEGWLAKEEAVLQRGQVDDTYREAFQLVRRGEYNSAVPRFREFLRKNGKSEFADNAQFWIGECYFATRDYNRAILEFNEVLLKYPKGEKVSAALLRQAYAFAELGDKVDARLILQKLLSEYPRSEEAERARQKLQTLGD